MRLTLSLLLMLAVTPATAQTYKQRLAAMVAVVNTGELECGLKPNMGEYQRYIARAGEDGLHILIAAEQARQRVQGKKVDALIVVNDPEVEAAVGQMMGELNNDRRKNGKAAMCTMIEALMKFQLGVLR